MKLNKKKTTRNKRKTKNIPEKGINVIHSSARGVK